jgi:hypothetical protein
MNASLIHFVLVHAEMFALTHVADIGELVKKMRAAIQEEKEVVEKLQVRVLPEPVGGYEWRGGQRPVWQGRDRNSNQLEIAEAAVTYQ